MIIAEKSFIEYTIDEMFAMNDSITFPYDSTNYTENGKILAKITREEHFTPLTFSTKDNRTTFSFFRAGKFIFLVFEENTLEVSFQ